MPPARAPSFPVLETRRLRLRPPAPSDAAALRALLAFPEVTRFSNWPDAPTRSQAERYVRWMIKLLASRRGCAWMIALRDATPLIGCIRFNHIERKWKYAELGYELHPDHWGQGLMTEALRAVVACGHGDFGLNRLEAWTMPGNGASDRVLEKAGFRYEGTHRQKAWFKGDFHDFRMFGRLACDPPASTAA